MVTAPSPSDHGAATVRTSLSRVTVRQMADVVGHLGEHCRDCLGGVALDGELGVPVPPVCSRPPGRTGWWPGRGRGGRGLPLVGLVAGPEPGEAAQVADAFVAYGDEHVEAGRGCLQFAERVEAVDPLARGG